MTPNRPALSEATLREELERRGLQMKAGRRVAKAEKSARITSAVAFLCLGSVLCQLWDLMSLENDVRKLREQNAKHQPAKLLGFEDGEQAVNGKPLELRDCSAAWRYDCVFPDIEAGRLNPPNPAPLLSDPHSGVSP